MACVVITLLCIPGWGKSYDSFPIKFQNKSLHQQNYFVQLTNISLSVFFTSDYRTSV